MKNYLLMLTLCCINLPSFANCDLKHFRWECDIPVNPNKYNSGRTLVYCRDTPIYLSLSDYQHLVQYQRRHVNMVLKVDDTYLEGPCIPADQFKNPPK